MTTIWGWTVHRPWQSHGDGGFVIRHGDMDDGDDDDDTDDDNDHKNDSYTAAGAAPGASIIHI